MAVASQTATESCVAVCCSVFQCVAIRCSAFQYVAVRHGASWCVAVRCSVLQCVAVCCSALQCVAVCCNALQCVFQRVAAHTRADWKKSVLSLFDFLSSSSAVGLIRLMLRELEAPEAAACVGAAPVDAAADCCGLLANVTACASSLCCPPTRGFSPSRARSLFLLTPLSWSFK